MLNIYQLSAIRAFHSFVRSSSHFARYTGANTTTFRHISCMCCQLLSPTLIHGAGKKRSTSVSETTLEQDNTPKQLDDDHMNKQCGCVLT